MEVAARLLARPVARSFRCPSAVARDEFSQLRLSIQSTRNDADADNKSTNCVCRFESNWTGPVTGLVAVASEDVESRMAPCLRWAPLPAHRSLGAVCFGNKFEQSCI